MAQCMHIAVNSVAWYMSVLHVKLKAHTLNLTECVVWSDLGIYFVLCICHDISVIGESNYSEK